MGCGPRKPVSPLPSFASLVWFLVNQVKHVTIRDGKDKEPIKARFTPITPILGRRVLMVPTVRLHATSNLFRYVSRSLALRRPLQPWTVRSGPLDESRIVSRGAGRHASPTPDELVSNNEGSIPKLRRQLRKTVMTLFRVMYVPFSNVNNGSATASGCTTTSAALAVLAFFILGGGGCCKSNPFMVAAA